MSYSPGGRPSIANAPCASDSVSLFVRPWRTMRAPGKTAGSPFCVVVKTSPRIDPGVAGWSCGKQRTRSTRVEKTISEIVRTAVLLSAKGIATRRPNYRREDANSVKPLRQRVFETLSRRIHGASFWIAREAGLVRCRSLGEFLAAIFDDADGRQSESIERRYSALPLKW